MKKHIQLFALFLLLAACAKEPESENRTYDFNGRVYERYNTYSFMPNHRSYYTLEFLNDTSVLRYNGTDTLGVDSVWYRKDTVMVSQLKPYRYRVTDVPQYYPYPWDCVAYIDFYKFVTHSYHGEDYENVQIYFTSLVSTKKLDGFNL